MPCLRYYKRADLSADSDSKEYLTRALIMDWLPPLGNSNLLPSLHSNILREYTLLLLSRMFVYRRTSLFQSQPPCSSLHESLMTCRILFWQLSKASRQPATNTAEDLGLKDLGFKIDFCLTFWHCSGRFALSLSCNHWVGWVHLFCCVKDETLPVPLSPHKGHLCTYCPTSRQPCTARASHACVYVVLHNVIPAVRWVWQKDWAKVDENVLIALACEGVSL